jgi:hypothetical protein
LARPLTFILSPYRNGRGDNIHALFETDNWQTLQGTAFQNLFARQGASHLINLAKTIRLHAYATNIQN